MWCVSLGGGRWPPWGAYLGDAARVAAVGLALAGASSDDDEAIREAVAAGVLALAVAAGDLVRAGGNLGGEGRGSHGDGQNGEEAGELHGDGWKLVLEKRKMCFVCWLEFGVEACC